MSTSMPLKPVSLGCGPCQPGPASQTLPRACLWGRLLLDTNKWSEGSWCLSLNWKFVLVLSRTRRRGGSSQGQQVGTVGRCPTAFSLLPAQRPRMTWGTSPCIKSWAVLVSSLSSANLFDPWSQQEERLLDSSPLL